MTKTYTKGAKLRAKKALTGFDLAEVPKRQPNGQHRQRADKPQDPQKTALGARCRLFGIANTPANRKFLSGQHSGSHLGYVMQANCDPQDIPPLWDTWHGFCSALRTYRIRYIGMSATAKGAALQMMPEPMETDPSLTVDLRDSDERDRDAVNAYMRWKGDLWCLSVRERSLLSDAESETGKDLWKDGQATRAGLDTLAALRALHEVKQSR